MVFCNTLKGSSYEIYKEVTILILIDGFLQYPYVKSNWYKGKSHNPYFNRWFSAILVMIFMMYYDVSHNPYFNRWFSAIKVAQKEKATYNKSQSLF